FGKEREELSGAECPVNETVGAGRACACERYLNGCGAVERAYVTRYRHGWRFERKQEWLELRAAVREAPRDARAAALDDRPCLTRGELPEACRCNEFVSPAGRNGSVEARCQAGVHHLHGCSRKRREQCVGAEYHDFSGLHAAVRIRVVRLRSGGPSCETGRTDLIAAGTVAKEFEPEFRGPSIGNEHCACHSTIRTCEEKWQTRDTAGITPDSISRTFLRWQRMERPRAGLSASASTKPAHRPTAFSLCFAAR